MYYSENYQEEQEAFCLLMHRNQQRMVLCKVCASQAQTYIILDLLEGNSWARYLDCGPVSDIITV